MGLAKTPRHGLTELQQQSAQGEGPRSTAQVLLEVGSPLIRCLLNSRHRLRVGAGGTTPRAAGLLARGCGAPHGGQTTYYSYYRWLR